MAINDDIMEDEEYTENLLENENDEEYGFPADLMENEDYPKSNREKRTAPKRGLFYCGYCDRDMVSNGSRCETCGHREGTKRLKKDTSI